MAGKLDPTLELLNEASNRLATRIRALEDKINTGMTQTEVDKVKGDMEALAVRLDGFAADPANPVPPEPEPAPPVP